MLGEATRSDVVVRIQGMAPAPWKAGARTVPVNVGGESRRATEAGSWAMGIVPVSWAAGRVPVIVAAAWAEAAEVANPAEALWRA